ncbi:hypothetical protein KUV62_13575 [Salipiger bermudensis]|uniref:hypothetical protein n=1 Tax=Salipiger bermudensis TaxID=344736 RepID=UPI001C9999C8|nr:hypothetical protein [Salipiger bermudensis]MBY6004945.1 hypothetical protein [Salipiger bermudensis]
MSLAFVRGLALACGICAALPAQANLSELRAALVALDSRDLDTARRLVEASAAELTTVAERSATLADEVAQMAQTCDRRLDLLHVLRGEALQLKSDSEGRLREIRTRLDNAVSEAAAAQAEITAVRVAIDMQRRSLAEHRRKVEELRTWFWVPGYGLFLGIRELVDRDSRKIDDLGRDLAHETRVLHDADHRARLERDLATHFTATISRDEVHVKLVERTSSVVQDRIAALRILSDTLHDAQGHWAQVEALAKIDGYAEETRFRREIERAVRRLEAPVASPELLGLKPEATVSFVQVLATLEARLEDGGLMRRLRASDCAGDAAEVPEQPEACPLPRFAYFDMSSDAPCSYTYRNPPGCPPAPHDPRQAMRSAFADSIIHGAIPGTAIAGNLTGDDIYDGPVTVVPQNYAQQFTQVTEHVAGHNFVGAARCLSPEALYFGKQESHVACSNMCDGAECLYWSFYADDSELPGSAGECWGGTARLAPDIESAGWRGVISGGSACDEDGITCNYDRD